MWVCVVQKLRGKGNWGVWRNQHRAASVVPNSSYLFYKRISADGLLVLMTVLTQSLLTLVSGHLVSLFLLSVRHCFNF